MGCFSFLIMLLSYCHNFPVNIYLLAVTCFSPGAVKFIQRIHLHHFFFYQFFSSEFLVENLTYCIFFCGGGGRTISFSLFYFYFFAAIEFFPQTNFLNMEYFRTVSILNCHSHFHITCGRSSMNWESIEKLLYTQLYAEICGTERPHSQTRNWCSCPAFLGLFFFFFSNTDMAPLSVYNVSNMRLNQSWT